MMLCMHIRKEGYKMLRKLRRNILKKKMGSNRIRSTWRFQQIKKFGVTLWAKMYVRCVLKRVSIGDVIYSPYDY